MKKLGYVLLLLVLIIVSYSVAAWNNKRSNGSSSTGSAKTLLYYHCPMHPGFRSDKPGTAPCCGMELEPVYAGEETGGTEAKRSLPPGAVQISLQKQQLIGVRTGVAQRSSAGRTLRLLGRVAADETRLYKIKAAADGWIEDVYPVTTGSFVKKGQPLASFYTPAFITSAQYYVGALGNLDRRVLGTERTLQTYEDTLRGLGADSVVLDEMKKTRQIARSILLNAPANGFVLLREVSEGLRFQKGEELYRIAELSHVWVYADLYENEARYVRAGARAKVVHPQMGEQFTARVSDILPQFDPASRTLKVRLEVDNPRNILRPDMFVDVEFPLNLPASLTVPAEAVLDTGVQKTVFVDLGDGVFEPRRVETGWRMDNTVEIVKGLMEGEKIVVSGNFLIDSESRLQGLASSYRTPGEVDPVCGMTVDPAKAGTSKSEHQGKTYYFCNPSCKESFDKDPHSYLSKVKGSDTSSMERGAPPVAMGRKAAPPAEHKHIDPVCGMTVDPARAGPLKSEHEGKTYYFCNPSCKESFDKDPHSYLSKAKGSNTPAAEHAAPPAAMDHKEPPPADDKHLDPVCRMAVEPAKAEVMKSEYEGKTYYFCSRFCKDSFDREPQRYLVKAAHDEGTVQ